MLNNTWSDVDRWSQKWKSWQYCYALWTRQSRFLEQI